MRKSRGEEGSAAERRRKLTLLARDLDEAREQQAATADVLKVISGSTFDLDAVLTTVIRSGIKLCDATRGVVWLKRGQQLYLAAHLGYSDEWVNFAQSNPIIPAADALTTSGLAAFTGEVVHVEDVPNDPRFRSLAAHKLGDYRAGVAVPLKRDAEVIGVISLSRPEARLFTERQVALLQTFADQAVIAIENTRLFREIESRNREITETLDQQTATSNILGVIASSPGDVAPVLEAIAESAARLCQAFDAIVRIKEGEFLIFGAHYGPIPVDPKAWAISRKWTGGRSVVDRTTIHVHDLADAAEEFPEGWAMAHRFGHRTTLAVPLLREGEAIGTMMLRRMEVKPFTEAQISLLRTFADQAVIAIENARLFEEVRTRNRELSETLEQQVATSAILRAIAASPTDIQPVLDAVAESAAQLCDAYDTTIFLRREDELAVASHRGVVIRMDYDFLPLRRDIVPSRAVLDGQVVHVHDLMAVGQEFATGQKLAVQMGSRTVLAAPLMWEGTAIGALMIRRTEVRPFGDRQIQLLKTFADQAVIAIENVRLFEEVQARNRALTESLEQQTATSEILSVISKSPTNVQPVFDTIAESAARLCEARFCAVFRFDGEVIHFSAQHGMPAEAAEIQRRAYPMAPGLATASSRAILSGKVEQIPDVDLDRHYTLKGLTTALATRSVLSVPMLRNGQPVGAINIARSEPGHFPDRQIELLKTFADQAVIAIENVRLFDEVQARTGELTESLQQQTATADVLKVISRSAFDLPSVLQTLVDSAVRLCGADLGAITMREGDSLRFMAGSGQSPELRAYEVMHPHQMNRGTFQGRAAVEKATVHVPDVRQDAEYQRQEAAALGDFRASLAVPLRRGGEIIGVFGLARRTVGPFFPRQIELVENFADQAVIAIENARLFEEVQARTRELSEALQQQTATADVLKVISRSAFDLQTVLDTLVESAIRLCRADKGGIVRSLDGVLRYVATYGYPTSFRSYVDANPPAPGRGSAVGRVVSERRIVQIHDVTADPDYVDSAIAEAGGFRTVLAVPLFRENELIGVFVMTRVEIRPFDEREIELVTTFADQAVIAIENTRLFEEVQKRTTELTEALQQQTATADVLKVISRSAFDVQAVLDTLATSAARLCEADIVDFYRLVDDGFQWAASFGAEAEADRHHTMLRREPGRGSASGRVLLEQKTAHIPDWEADAEFTFVDVARKRGVRAILGVPLLRGNVLIGLLLVMRRLPGPFSTKQIELAETFADQAVIAIENVRLFGEVQARNRDLTESLERQTAMSDILRVISRSPIDVQPVFETIAESAARLCSGHFCTVFRFDGKLIHFVAQHGLPPEAVEEQRRAFPMLPGLGSGASRAILSAAVEQIPDVNADPDYQVGETARAIGARSVLAVPMLRDGRPVGSINIGRQEPGGFPSRQIELLQTFADQAVIAIENVRLFEEVQARTAELSEALQQQTATADVLKVINRSAFDLQPVFQALIDSAVRLCGADMGAITLRRGDSLQFMAGSGHSAELGAYERSHPHLLGRGTFQGRAAVEGKAIHVPDVLEDSEYERREAAIVGEFRAALSVPLKRGHEVIGVFGLARRTVGPFSPRQVELVETFADQAVIAIENVRLFEEVHARTRDLSEALEQQTATADVLKAISRSTFDLPSVLQTLVQSAARLCEADIGTISREIDGMFFDSECYGLPPGLLELIRTIPIKQDRGSAAGRALLEGKVIQIADVLSDPEYTFSKEAQGLAGFRTLVGVPMLREHLPIGVLTLGRRDVRPFTEKQIELVSTFADQAVIAIENVRLFDEVQAKTRDLEESLTFQKATGGVLEVIGRSASNLQPVFDVILDTAADLCHADMSVLRLMRDGALQHVASSRRNDPAVVQHSRENPIVSADRSSVAGRVALAGHTIHIPDVAQDAEYTFLRNLDSPIGSVLGVPLLQDGKVAGVIALLRRLAQPFTQRQIELVETFADQAVIAIENVRLFEEVQTRTEELSRSLQELRTAQDRLVQTEKLASLGQLTAGIAHEIKNPLNFVNNFSSLSGELIEELREALASAPVENKIREEVAELTGLLKSNLEKVVEHGKRADSIVKNMLLHSRAGSGDRRPSDINAIVEESLNLAYHGARAEKQGFNITIEKSLDPSAGEVDLFPQEITRVLLNLISNGFYAAGKRKALSDGPYEPTLSAATRDLGEKVEIRIRDNGTGISPEVREKMFNPFFTTKPAGEGTGLGLSLSHDIVVKQHAGTIDVESEPGSYTEFRIVLPRSGAMLGKTGGEA